MMIFSNNTVTEYGITGGGNYYERHRKSNVVLFRSTPHVSKFLQWITNSEMMFCEQVKQQLKRKNGNNN